MAEIKSTLDIIMERTKNLTMTEEDKKALQRKEWEGKVTGWVQKHLDGLIDIDTLKSDFDIGRRKYPELPQILRSTLLAHVNLNGNSEIIFQLLKILLGIKTKTVDDIVLSSKSELDTGVIKRVESLREELKKRKIYGSAIVPNLNHDETWQMQLQKLNSDFIKQVTSLTDNF